MCGICGYFGAFARVAEQADILRAMTGALAHRGPDSSGYYIAPKAGLGFRRLSFIDLDGGQQPIGNEDESLLMICNGEIYNYRELTRELVSKGHRFRTGTDVEALLHLYEESGLEFLNRINGQFAFALYDNIRHELLLVRDPVGVNPLFYTEAGGAFFFASEIKALLQNPHLPRAVDLHGLDQVLSYPGLVSPTTMFQGIRSLPAGHYLRVTEQGIEEHTYWDLDYPKCAEAVYDRAESRYLDELLAILTEAIRLRMHAEVPVGFYLSGGLDSSMIGALVRQILPGGGVQSFGIEFEEQDFSESEYQRLMARTLASHHHVLDFSSDEIERRLGTVVRHCECPLKETYNTASIALSECARTAGVRAVLTGEGADELFAGYVGYKFDLMRGSGQGTPQPENAAGERDLRQRLWGNPDLFYENNYVGFREVKRRFYSEQLAAVLPEFDCTERDVVDRGKLTGRHPLHQRSYLDFKLRMQDHLLGDHGDRMALANSVEARYPFLDLNFIRHAICMPPELKLNGFTEKYALRKAAQGLVPPKIARREKYAFVAPGSPQLLRRRVEWIEDTLACDRIRREGYLNPETIESLKERYRRPDFVLNPSFEIDLMMVAITFGAFLETFEMPSLN